MNNNITNEEIVKIGIRDSILIKTREGQSIEQIYKALSNQFYKFISREEGFTSQNISRGMRDIVTEENRQAIVVALGNIYFDFISKNGNVLNDKYDNYVKDMLENSGDLNRLMKTILGNREMIYRMRRSFCRNCIK